MNTHTPGPWRLRGKRDGLYIIERGATAPKGYGLPVASVFEEGNVKIVAAAPDLLKAMKEASRYLLSRSTPYNLLWDAIAKVEGE